MKGLIHLVKGKPVVSSLIIAREFERRHDNVIRIINSLVNSGHLDLLNTEEINYFDKRNRKQIVIELDEKAFLIAIHRISA